MGKHCSKGRTFAGVLTLKGRPQENLGVCGTSTLRNRELMCCEWDWRGRGGWWMCRGASKVLDCIQVSTPRGGQSLADLCFFISDHHACLVFSQNYSGCQEKGRENFSGENTRDVKVEVIGRILFQTWLGAAEASAAAIADTGM